MCVRNANNYSLSEYYANECPMSNVFLQCKMLGTEVPPKRGKGLHPERAKKAEGAGRMLR